MKNRVSKDVSQNREFQWREQKCKKNQKKFISKVYTEMKISQAGFGSIGEQEGEKKISMNLNRWNEII